MKQLYAFPEQYIDSHRVRGKGVLGILRRSCAFWGRMSRIGWVMNIRGMKTDAYIHTNVRDRKSIAAGDAVGMSVAKGLRLRMGRARI